MGFNDPDLKYLVYYNGPVDGSACGVSDNNKFKANTTTFSSVFLGNCAAALGVGGDTAATAVHEFIHSLHALAVSDPGGLPPSTCAPGVENSPGHPCDNPADLMAPQALPGQPPLSSYVLDAGRDDYYAHGGNWTDVHDSWFLVHLDKGDPNPPTGLNRFTPTSELSRVQGFRKQRFVSVLRWSKARDPGGVTYRVYQDGELVGITKKRRFDILTPSELAKTRKGKVIVVGVRAVDASGNLGPLRTVRFKVAFGIVNAKGKVTKDTVGPPPTKRIRFSQTATTVTLRWARAKDTVSPIKNYLVKRNGKRVKLVKRPTITVPQSKAKGRWTVQARDKAGNLAVVVNVLTVS